MSHPRGDWKDFTTLAPDAGDIVRALGEIAAKAGIDRQLLELVKLRASQINGCAFCVQYYILQAVSLGKGTGLSHLCDRFDQCLEQVRGRLSLDPDGPAGHPLRQSVASR
jgi:Carboxymuconolactone decarboxylase family